MHTALRDSLDWPPLQEKSLLQSIPSAEQIITDLQYPVYLTLTLILSPLLPSDSRTLITLLSLKSL